MLHTLGLLSSVGSRLKYSLERGDRKPEFSEVSFHTETLVRRAESCLHPYLVSIKTISGMET